MNTILISTLATLAGKWQQQADSDMAHRAAARAIEALVVARMRGER